MAVLAHTSRPERHLLGASHLVGRSRSCRLRLRGDWVSGEHASIRWTAGGWQIRDLGSRNGTWVEGRRLETGRPVALLQGMRVGFGRREADWVLEDASPPEPRAVGLGSAEGEEQLGVDGLLVLPRPDRPLACVHEGDHGLWVLEHDEGVEVVRDGQIVEVAGASFELELPQLVDETRERKAAPGRARVELRVSRDEEHIEVSVGQGEELVALGHRSFSELVLHLARARLEDGELSESEQGWRYADEAGKGLGLDRCQLNMAVFRARQAVKKGGLDVELVERRRGSGQIRLAVDEVEVTNF